MWRRGARRSRHPLSRRPAALAVVLCIGAALVLGPEVTAGAGTHGSARPIWGIDWRTLYGKAPGWTTQTARDNGIGGLIFDASGLASDYSPSGRALSGLGAFNAQAERARCSAERRGFRVAAVLGDPQWASTEAWPVLSAAVSEISYSATWQHCPVQALYLDIEPWGLDPAPSHEAALAALARTVRKVHNELHPARLPLGVFLPAWVRTTPGGAALVRELGKGDIVAAMTYRSRATSPNGAVAQNRAVARFLHRTNRSVGLLVGMETGHVSEPGVSFFGTTRSRLVRVAGSVAGALESDPQFQGFFVDDMASLQRLRV